jgi:hypothetical protein
MVVLGLVWPVQRMRNTRFKALSIAIIRVRGSRLVSVTGGGPYFPLLAESQRNVVTFSWQLAKSGPREIGVAAVNQW